MSRSQHVQFRLHPEKSEDEGMALGVLNHWLGQGYDVRYIMTCALLALEGYDLPPLIPDDMEIIKQLSSRMGNIIHQAVRESVGAEMVIHSSKPTEFSRPSPLNQVDEPHRGQSMDKKTMRLATKYMANMQEGLRDDE